jgi:hypothetical protein
MWLISIANVQTFVPILFWRSNFVSVKGIVSLTECLRVDTFRCQIWRDYLVSDFEPYRRSVPISNQAS